ncbi:MAG: c-type cytochrome [Steroidobacteraceae bacterium]|jgi:mono/diheme cytochrome c family protein
MTATPTRWSRALSAAVLALLAAAAAGPPVQADSASFFAFSTLDAQSGEQVYRQICQGCHMPDGKGATGAGTYPSLAENHELASAQFMALTILKGRRNMPAFGAGHASGVFFATPALSSEQVAAVISFVRTHFGNHYTDVISVAQIEELDRSP